MINVNKMGHQWVKLSGVLVLAVLLIQPCGAFLKNPSGSARSAVGRRTVPPRDVLSVPSNAKHVKSDHQKLEQSSVIDSPSPSRMNQEVQKSSARQKETVPSTMAEAIRRFFVGGDHGPLLVVGSISFLVIQRLQLAVLPSDTIPLGAGDSSVALFSIVFWWFQEHFIHGALLHSKFDWVGRRIHEEHHEKDYFSISIDPPALLIGWLAVAHGITRLIFPLPLALSATVGYAFAGLWYEWAHYLAHTRVKPRSKFLKQMRDNHIRHHRVNDRYWLGFSVPAVDDIFGTNPSLADARVERAKAALTSQK